MCVCTSLGGTAAAGAAGLQQPEPQPALLPWLALPRAAPGAAAASGPQRTNALQAALVNIVRDTGHGKVLPAHRYHHRKMDLEIICGSDF